MTVLVAVRMFDVIFQEKMKNAFQRFSPRMTILNVKIVLWENTY